MLADILVVSLDSGLHLQYGSAGTKASAMIPTIAKPQA